MAVDKTGAAVGKNDAVALAKNSIYSVLNNPKTLDAIKNALPDMGVTPQRVASIAFSVIAGKPQLLECDARSLVKVIIEGSLLGLSFDPHLKQAAIVPFKNQGKPEATLIVMYMGLVKLARNSGVLRHITAEMVYERDEFDYQLGLDPNLTHKPAKGERGKPIGVYAVGVLNGGDRVFRYLQEREVNFYREKSRAKDSADSPWTTDPESMWRKTAIRRLCGYLPMDDKTQRAVHDDEMIETGHDQILAAEIFAGDTIDITPEPKKSKTEEAKEKLRKQTDTTSAADTRTVSEQPEASKARIEEPRSAGEERSGTPAETSSDGDRLEQYVKAFDLLSGIAKSKQEADVLVSEATLGKVQSLDALKASGTLAQLQAVIDNCIEAGVTR